MGRSKFPGKPSKSINRKRISVLQLDDETATASATASVSASTAAATTTPASSTPSPALTAVTATNVEASLLGESSATTTTTTTTSSISSGSIAASAPSSAAKKKDDENLTTILSLAQSIASATANNKNHRNHRDDDEDDNNDVGGGGVAGVGSGSSTSTSTNLNNTSSSNSKNNSNGSNTSSNGSGSGGGGGQGGSSSTNGNTTNKSCNKSSSKSSSNLVRNGHEKFPNGHDKNFAIKIKQPQQQLKDKKNDHMNYEHDQEDDADDEDLEEEEEDLLEDEEENSKETFDDEEDEEEDDDEDEEDDDEDFDSLQDEDYENDPDEEEDDDEDEEDEEEENDLIEEQKNSQENLKMDLNNGAGAASISSSYKVLKKKRSCSPYPRKVTNKMKPFSSSSGLSAISPSVLARNRRGKKFQNLNLNKPEVMLPSSSKLKKLQEQQQQEEEQEKQKQQQEEEQEKQKQQEQTSLQKQLNCSSSSLTSPISPTTTITTIPITSITTTNNLIENNSTTTMATTLNSNPPSPLPSTTKTTTEVAATEVASSATPITITTSCNKSFVSLANNNQQQQEQHEQQQKLSEDNQKSTINNNDGSQPVTITSTTTIPTTTITNPVSTTTTILKTQQQNNSSDLTSKNESFSSTSTSASTSTTTTSTGTTATTTKTTTTASTASSLSTSISSTVSFSVSSSDDLINIDNDTTTPTAATTKEGNSLISCTENSSSSSSSLSTITTTTTTTSSSCSKLNPSTTNFNSESLTNSNTNTTTNTTTTTATTITTLKEVATTTAATALPATATVPSSSITSSLADSLTSSLATTTTNTTSFSSSSLASTSSLSASSSASLVPKSSGVGSLEADQPAGVVAASSPSSPPSGSEAAAVLSSNSTTTTASAVTTSMSVADSKNTNSSSTLASTSSSSSLLLQNNSTTSNSTTTSTGTSTTSNSSSTSTSTLVTSIVPDGSIASATTTSTVSLSSGSSASNSSTSSSSVSSKGKQKKTVTFKNILETSDDKSATKKFYNPNNRIPLVSIMKKQCLNRQATYSRSKDCIVRPSRLTEILKNNSNIDKTNSLKFRSSKRRNDEDLVDGNITTNATTTKITTTTTNISNNSNNNATVFAAGLARAFGAPTADEAENQDSITFRLTNTNNNNNNNISNTNNSNNSNNINGLSYTNNKSDIDKDGHEEKGPHGGSNELNESDGGSGAGSSSGKTVGIDLDEDVTPEKKKGSENAGSSEEDDDDQQVVVDKHFILPKRSTRSSRVIKPNKRLLEDGSICKKSSISSKTKASKDSNNTTTNTTTFSALPEKKEQPNYFGLGRYETNEEQTLTSSLEMKSSESKVVTFATVPSPFSNFGGLKSNSFVLRQSRLQFGSLNERTSTTLTINNGNTTTVSASSSSAGASSSSLTNSLAKTFTQFGGISTNPLMACATGVGGSATGSSSTASSKFTLNTSGLSSALLNSSGSSNGSSNSTSGSASKESSIPGACGVCSTPMHCKNSQQVRKFGALACETCRRFVSKITKKSVAAGTNSPIERFQVQCKSDGESPCLIVAHPKAQKNFKRIFKERCLACWLKKCIQTFNFTNSQKIRLSSVLPDNFKLNQNELNLKPSNKNSLDKLSNDHLQQQQLQQQQHLLLDMNLKRGDSDLLSMNSVGGLFSNQRHSTMTTTATATSATTSTTSSHSQFKWKSTLDTNATALSLKMNPLAENNVTFGSSCSTLIKPAVLEKPLFLKPNQTSTQTTITTPATANLLSLAGNQSVSSFAEDLFETECNEPLASNSKSSSSSSQKVSKRRLDKSKDKERDKDKDKERLLCREESYSAMSGDLLPDKFQPENSMLNEGKDSSSSSLSSSSNLCIAVNSSLNLMGSSLAQVSPALSSSSVTCTSKNDSNHSPNHFNSSTLSPSGNNSSTSAALAATTATTTANGLETQKRQRIDLKGPRVKHVCRSASIVLGQPLAMFGEEGNSQPAPESSSVNSELIHDKYSSSSEDILLIDENDNCSSCKQQQQQHDKQQQGQSPETQEEEQKQKLDTKLKQKEDKMSVASSLSSSFAKFNEKNLLQQQQQQEEQEKIFVMKYGKSYERSASNSKDSHSHKQKQSPEKPKEKDKNSLQQNQKNQMVDEGLEPPPAKLAKVQLSHYEEKKLESCTMSATSSSSLTATTITTSTHSSLQPLKISTRSNHTNSLPGLRNGSTFSKKYSSRGFIMAEPQQPPPPTKRKQALSKAKAKTKTLISIDFWENYDPAEVCQTGFGLIITETVAQRALCFLCGSSGLEPLIFCACCCEPYHQYCVLDEYNLKHSSLDDTMVSLLDASTTFSNPNNLNDFNNQMSQRLNWLCPRCTVCYTCNMSSGSKVKCQKCQKNYHSTCLGTSKRLLGADRPLICVNCLKCKSCGTTKVSKFVGNLPMCNACFKQRKKGNFCPICQKCYDDNDFDLKMMECGDCQQWVHSKCEGLTDEQYNLLSTLPESIEFVCKKCARRNENSKQKAKEWRQAVLEEFKQSLLSVLKLLSKSRQACALLKVSPRKKMKCSCNSNGGNSFAGCTPLTNSSATCSIAKMQPKTLQFNDGMGSDGESQCSDDVYEFRESSHDDKLKISKCSCPSGSVSGTGEPGNLGLVDIKKKISSNDYISLAEFNYEMNSIIQQANCDDLMLAYKEILSEQFPWFQNETKACTDALEEDMFESCGSYNLNNDHEQQPNFCPEEEEVHERTLINLPEDLDEVIYSIKTKEDTRSCLLCRKIGEGLPNEESRLLYCGHDCWIHTNCALWSAEVFEEIDGSLQNVHAAVSRGRMIKCTVCGNRGATVGCNVKSCGEHYHFPCARSLQCAFFTDKTIFCPEHAKNSITKIPTSVTIETNFEVTRPVYVELDRKRKKLLEPNKVQFHIGSLEVKQMGNIFPRFSDTFEALVPINYLCSRLYWSSKEPWKIVEYTIRTTIQNNYSTLTTLDSGRNFTVDHSNPNLASVQKNLAQIARWHKSLTCGDLLDYDSNSTLSKLLPDFVNHNQNSSSGVDENNEEEPQTNADLLPPEIKDVIFEDLRHELLDGISMLDIFPKSMIYEELGGGSASSGASGNSNSNNLVEPSNPKELFLNEQSKDGNTTNSTHSGQSSQSTTVQISDDDLTSWNSSTNLPASVNHVEDALLSVSHRSATTSQSQPQPQAKRLNTLNRADLLKKPGNHQRAWAKLENSTAAAAAAIKRRKISKTLPENLVQSWTQQRTTARKETATISAITRHQTTSSQNGEMKTFTWSAAKRYIEPSSSGTVQRSTSSSLAVAGNHQKDEPKLKLMQVDGVDDSVTEFRIVSGENQYTGAVKCERCQCTYRTYDSYQRHLVSCEPISTSESESDTNSRTPETQSPMGNTTTILTANDLNKAASLQANAGTSGLPFVQTFTQGLPLGNLQANLNGLSIAGLQGLPNVQNIQNLQNLQSLQNLQMPNLQTAQSLNGGFFLAPAPAPTTNTTDDLSYLTNSLQGLTANLNGTYTLTPSTAFSAVQAAPPQTQQPQLIALSTNPDGTQQLIQIPASATNQQLPQLQQIQTNHPFQTLQATNTDKKLVLPMNNGKPLKTMSTKAGQQNSNLAKQKQNKNNSFVKPIQSKIQQQAQQPQQIPQQTPIVLNAAPNATNQLLSQNLLQQMQAQQPHQLLFQTQPNPAQQQPLIMQQLGPPANNTMAQNMFAVVTNDGQIQYVSLPATNDFKPQPQPQPFLTTAPATNNVNSLLQGGAFLQTDASGNLVLTTAPPQTQPGLQLMSASPLNAQPQVIGTLIQPQTLQVGNNLIATTTDPNQPQQVIIGAGGSGLEMLAAANAAAQTPQIVLATQPMFYGLETIVQNTVMSSQQFVSTAMPGVLSQNASFSATTTQVFQASKIEPIVDIPTGYVVLNNVDANGQPTTNTTNFLNTTTVLQNQQQQQQQSQQQQQAQSQSQQQQQSHSQQQQNHSTNQQQQQIINNTLVEQQNSPSSAADTTTIYRLQNSNENNGNSLSVSVAPTTTTTTYQISNQNQQQTQQQQSQQQTIQQLQQHQIPNQQHQVQSQQQQVPSQQHQVPTQQHQVQNHQHQAASQQHQIPSQQHFSSSNSSIVTAKVPPQVSQVKRQTKTSSVSKVQPQQHQLQHQHTQQHQQQQAQQQVVNKVVPTTNKNMNISKLQQQQQQQQNYLQNHQQQQQNIYISSSLNETTTTPTTTTSIQIPCSSSSLISSATNHSATPIIITTLANTNNNSITKTITTHSNNNNNNNNNNNIVTTTKTLQQNGNVRKTIVRPINKAEVKPKIMKTKVNINLQQQQQQQLLQQQQQQQQLLLQQQQQQQQQKQQTLLQNQCQQNQHHQQQVPQQQQQQTSSPLQAQSQPQVQTTQLQLQPQVLQQLPNLQHFQQENHLQQQETHQHAAQPTANLINNMILLKPQQQQQQQSQSQPQQHNNLSQQHVGQQIQNNLLTTSNNQQNSTSPLIETKTFIANQQHLNNASQQHVSLLSPDASVKASQHVAQQYQITNSTNNSTTNTNNIMDRNINLNACSINQQQLQQQQLQQQQLQQQETIEINQQIQQHQQQHQSHVPQQFVYQQIETGSQQLPSPDLEEIEISSSPLPNMATNSTTTQSTQLQQTSLATSASLNQSRQVQYTATAYNNNVPTNIVNPLQQSLQYVATTSTSTATTTLQQQNINSRPTNRVLPMQQRIEHSTATTTTTTTASNTALATKFSETKYVVSNLNHLGIGANSPKSYLNSSKTAYEAEVKQIMDSPQHQIQIQKPDLDSEPPLQLHLASPRQTYILEKPGDLKQDLDVMETENLSLGCHHPQQMSLVTNNLHSYSTAATASLLSSPPIPNTNTSASDKDLAKLSEESPLYGNLNNFKASQEQSSLLVECDDIVDCDDETDDGFSLKMPTEDDDNDMSDSDEPAVKEKISKILDNLTNEDCADSVATGTTLEATTDMTHVRRFITEDDEEEILENVLSPETLPKYNNTLPDTESFEASVDDSSNVAAVASDFISQITSEQLEPQITESQIDVHVFDLKEKPDSSLLPDSPESATTSPTEDLPVEKILRTTSDTPPPLPNPLRDPRKISGPHLLYEIQSEDGFTYKSTSITEVWEKVFEAVQVARRAHGLAPLPEGPLADMSGVQMIGLKTNALRYLIEQLPGVERCTKYTPKYHNRSEFHAKVNGLMPPTPLSHCHSDDANTTLDYSSDQDDLQENPYDSARCEPYTTRSEYDMFSWLASRHRKQPIQVFVQPSDTELVPRRGTGSNLPMAMKYRTLKETYKDYVGVFRSHIHGRGLYCTKDIEAGEMVIEYAGELIRSTLTDKRERHYDSRGIGCYMFKIDDNLVVDATMRGNAARFINHSCEPNCYSKVVDILGHKHIIIFALRRIVQGEELTYDYKFPFEDEKIPCSCGSKRCRKYLN